MLKPVVLIKGGGDLASGVAHRLARKGVGVMMTEIAHPTMVRRKVSFGNVVYERQVDVEGVQAVLCPVVKQAFMAVHSGKVAVLVDPTCSSLEFIRPAVLVDVIMAKRNTGTRLYDAPVVIAVGPGFTAGADCHAVVESVRGEDMGRVLYSGSAAPPTGRPGEVGGFSTERVLRAPISGVFRGEVGIGDPAVVGARVAYVKKAAMPRKRKDGAGERQESSLPLAEGDVIAQIAGVVRGLLADGLEVSKGQKVGDIDPTGQRERCFKISDKAHAVGRGVAEAIESLAPGVLGRAWRSAAITQ